MKIDDKDILIIRSLQLDARTTFSSIAKKAKLSVDTIAKRYRRLKRNKIIKKTTLLLDPRKFGKEIIVNFDISVQPSKIFDVLKMLEETKGILFATESLGDFGLFAIAEMKSMEEMNRLKEDIKGLPMVNKVSTSIWVEQFLLCPQNFEFEPMLES